MKRLLFLFAICYSMGTYAQDPGYVVYNYSQLVKMIQQEKDSIFELSEAFIVFDPHKDKRFSKTWARTGYEMNSTDTIYIEKEITFNKVIFEVVFRRRDSSGKQITPVFHHMVFKQPVKFENSHNASFQDCVFKDRLRIWNDDGISEITDKLKNNMNTTSMWMRIRSCSLENGLFYSNAPKLDDDLGYDFELSNSRVSRKSTNENSILAIIQMNNQRSLEVSNNIFRSKGWFFLFPRVDQDLSIENNDFGGAKIFMRSGQKGISALRFLGNNITNPILLDLPVIDDNASIDWSQLQGRIIHQTSFDKYFRNMSEHGLDSIPKLAEGHFRSKEKINYYLNNLRIQKEEAFKQEIKIRGRLYRIYKDQYQTEDANSVYMELKDLETERLKYLFRVNPSFDKFFKWKVNQFLKVFSNYGTEPSKAVTFSFYVVLFFALIYLLFPNSWDKHGKNRIMNRYRFFTKYMNRDAGIHEVYLEDQNEEFLASEEFKQYMLSAGKTVPSFFIKTAMPLYKWSVSGMKFSASLLKRVDVMRGTWQNVPEKRRTWKTILLVGAFSIALLYDVTIKILNALMLSINTFTTLGFGEIPIKGLPRYLAIIQGFIGWFMLTIFSVSLISQLLN